MLKSINKRFSLIFLLQVLFISCSFVNFKDIKIELSINENQRFFDDEYIIIDFSYYPDEKTVEQIVIIKENEKNTNLDILWNENSCKIKPHAGWKPGLNYQLTIKGNIRTVEKGDFSLDIERNFTYGIEKDLFKLISCSIKDYDYVDKTTSIVFEFNKPVNQYSYLESFQLSPSIDFRKDFIDNKVVITPAETWPINTVFSWKIKSIQSQDNYYIDKEYKGTFLSKEDLEIPYLKSIGIIDVADDSYYWIDDSLNNISNGQGIGFEFSKKMSLDSINNAITFSPAIKGDILLFPGDEGYKYMFIPSYGYKIDTDYKITIDTSAKDYNGIPIKKEYVTIFKSLNSFLTVLSITQDRSAQNIDDAVIFDGIHDSEINTITVANDTDNSEIFLIDFSTSIIPELQKLAEQCISFSLLFPATEASLSVSNIKWNQSNNQMIITVKGFSSGTNNRAVYYQIKITGGENGIKNSNDEYLKEDLCINFKSEKH